MRGMRESLECGCWMQCWGAKKASREALGGAGASVPSLGSLALRLRAALRPSRGDVARRFSRRCAAARWWR